MATPLTIPVSPPCRRLWAACRSRISGRARVTRSPRATASTMAFRPRSKSSLPTALNFLATYTWSKVLSDAHDLLNGGSANNPGSNNINGYRAPSIAAVGIQGDYGLAPFDIRNVFHSERGLRVAVWQGQALHARRADGSPMRWPEGGASTGRHSAGWAANHSRLPITRYGTSVACNAILINGQDPKTGLHTDANGKLNWFGNPGACTQPCVLGGVVGAPVPIPGSPSGCIPLDWHRGLWGSADADSPDRASIGWTSRLSKTSS